MVKNESTGGKRKHKVENENAWQKMKVFDEKKKMHDEKLKVHSGKLKTHDFK